MQLHPGDLGWFWQLGVVVAAAAAVRTWSRGGQIVAVGLLDGPELLRLTACLLTPASDPVLVEATLEPSARRGPIPSPSEDRRTEVVDHGAGHGRP